MPRTHRDYTADIFEESARALRAVGPEKTLQALKQAQNQENRHEDAIKIFVFEAVCKELNIKRSSLDGQAHGRRVEALTYISILLEKHLGYSLEQIRLCFKNPRSKGRLSQYKHDFILLDPNHPSDSKKIKEMDKISSKVDRYIKSIKHGT